ncbi:Zinc finger CCCH domain-containing protein 17 [Linum grandiflorum]
MVFKRNVFERIGVSGHDQKNTGIVCRFWKQGNCTHNPCRFVHGESPSPSPTPYSSHSRSNVYVRGGSQSSSQQSCSNVYDDEKKSPETICGEWKLGSCLRGDKCQFAHSWFRGDRLSMLGRLPGDALHTLAGPVGQVHALHSDTIGHVFAAAQDGTIWAWKISTDEQGNIFQPVASMIGHTSAVISLRCGAASRVYSGSIDGTIKVWDVKTWQCIETFKGHDDAVTSLLCYDAFLLSCSLDKKIKVWGLNEERRLEVIYTHEEAHAALALCGIDGIELCGKDVLLCSWNNESVGIYELPSFIEKGRMYSKGEVRGLGVGSKGMFFTGDASGVVTAWNMAEEVAEDGSSRQKKRRKMEQ